MKINLFTLLVIFLLANFKHLSSQTYIDNLLSKNTKIEFANNILPCIRNFNFHNTQSLNKGIMRLYVGHRMGEISGGNKTLFGLYSANVRIGADLGINKNLTFGLGTTSQQRIHDFYFKYKLISQSNIFPFNVSLVSNLAIRNHNPTFPQERTEFWQKLKYFHAISFSQNIKKNFNYQVFLALIHKNMVATPKDKNTIFAVGTSAFYKINRNFSLAAEYSLMPKSQASSTSISPHVLSFGMIYRKGPRHVFQIFFTNSPNQNEYSIITETTQKLSFNNIRLSFNLPTNIKVF